MATHPSGPLLDTSPAPFPGPSPLTGQHVRLERLSRSHIPDLYRNIGSDASLWTYIPSGPFPTPADFTALMEKELAMPEHAFYAIILLDPSDPSSSDGEEAVGHICLFRADLPNRAIEVGHVLYGGALQKTRAGTEALYLLGRAVFETWGYRRWEWKCDSCNAASGRAARRYGFGYEGCFRQHMVVKGRNRDTAWYSMLDSEWAGQRRVFETWLGEGNFDGEGRQRKRMEEVRESVLILQGES